MSQINSLLYIIFIALSISCKDNTSNSIETSEIKPEIELTQKPKIAILGTFHFDASSDYTSTNIDSLFSNKRQTELNNLVDKVKRFKPTKIMVEREPETKKELDIKLDEFLNGDFKLPKNEIYQIGFRLAQKAQIKELYPVDFQMDLGDGNLVEYLNKIDKFSVFEEFIGDLQKVASKETEYLKSHTLLEFFAKMNSKINDDFNRNLYLEKIPSISYNSNNALIEYTANWYKRNIVIMAQIDKQIQEDDRVLLLIGAGHRAILKDFYKNRTTVEYIEINEYLK